LTDLQGRFRVEEAKQAEQVEQSKKASHTFTSAKAENLDMASRANSEAQSFTRRRQQ